MAHLSSNRFRQDVLFSEISVGYDDRAVDQSNCDFTAAARAQHEGREIDQFRRAHSSTHSRADLPEFAGTALCG
jgi:hypothetical protein